MVVVVFPRRQSRGHSLPELAARIRYKLAAIGAQMAQMPLPLHGACRIQPYIHGPDQLRFCCAFLIRAANSTDMDRTSDARDGVVGQDGNTDMLWPCALQMLTWSARMPPDRLFCCHAMLVPSQVAAFPRTSQLRLPSTFQCESPCVDVRLLPTSTTDTHTTRASCHWH
ncbi:hypothetical protein N656DRAFT_785655 [Canariomyces notabilis]|uniref:Uncharacterized protein n=1 Tax=Canariomyces notabilis TaxID=2074819 RepID=A0AAN6QBH4_9PEZI|nr:hypothetical protein N656DRAFT_785655 [Canariomyces arenarius]